MLCSVIITTFNRAKILRERSLASALNQNFKSYEIIVVDDCGSDGTAEMMKEYPQVRYYRLEENKGVSYARNFGISKAVGRFVVCLDDDNELLSDFLAKTTEVLYNNPEVQAVAVGRIIQYQDFKDYAKPRVGKFSSMDWGWLFRKEVFNDLQYDPDLKASEDTDFGFKFFRKYKAVALNEPLSVAYDEWLDPKSSLSFPNKRELDGMRYFYRKNIGEYRDNPLELWHLYKLMGRKFYRGGYRREGIGWFWKGLRANPGWRSFAHWLFILGGWGVYDLYMSLEERAGAYLRK